MDISEPQSSLMSLNAASVILEQLLPDLKPQFYQGKAYKAKLRAMLANEMLFPSVLMSTCIPELVTCLHLE